MEKAKEATGNSKTRNPIVPEREPQRVKEEPTEPNRHIPERPPQRKEEEPNFPTPAIPEPKPEIPIIKPKDTYNQ